MRPPSGGVGLSETELSSHLAIVSSSFSTFWRLLPIWQTGEINIPFAKGYYSMHYMTWCSARRMWWISAPGHDSDIHNARRSDWFSADVSPLLMRSHQRRLTAMLPLHQQWFVAALPSLCWTQSSGVFCKASASGGLVCRVSNTRKTQPERLSLKCWGFVGIGGKQNFTWKS